LELQKASLVAGLEKRAVLAGHHFQLIAKGCRMTSTAPKPLRPEISATIESEQFAGALVAHLQGVRHCRFRNGARRSIGG
jgi:hypothetical protein